MVYLWDHGAHRSHLEPTAPNDTSHSHLYKDDFMFRKSAQFRHPFKVYNVVPGDYTQDGRLDLLVMGKGDSDGRLGMSLYVGAAGGGFGTHTIHPATRWNMTSL